MYLKKNMFELDLPGGPKFAYTNGLLWNFACELIYSRVPQIFPWRANLLQSLAPTLIKLT